MVDLVQIRQIFDKLFVHIRNSVSLDQICQSADSFVCLVAKDATSRNTCRRYQISGQQLINFAKSFDSIQPFGIENIKIGLIEISQHLDVSQVRITISQQSLVQQVCLIVLFHQLSLLFFVDVINSAKKFDCQTSTSDLQAKSGCFSLHGRILGEICGELIHSFACISMILNPGMLKDSN